MARREHLAGEPDLRTYDLILINTSGGKDSEVSMALAVERAKKQKAFERVMAVHAVLHGMEWPGVLELVQKQCEHFGIPLELVEAGGRWPSWYDYSAHRKEWPGFGTRFCTRGWKSTPIDKLVTQIKKLYQKVTGKKQIRVLQVMGMRADESSERAKRYSVYQHEEHRTNSERWTDLWLPLYDWTAPQVWKFIRAHKLPYHHVYDLGMERLSCAFCPLAGRHEIVQAARVAWDIDPALLDRIVEVEAAVGQPIKPGSRKNKPIWAKDLRSTLRAGKKIAAEAYDPAGEWCFPFADEED